MWRKCLIRETATVRDAVAAIDSGNRQIALVIDGNGRLLGTVTDGDVRRAILRGLELERPVTEIMHRNPTVTRAGDSREVIMALIREKHLLQIPLVDHEDRVVGLETIDRLIQRDNDVDNWAVLMAGGLGTRLSPLTADTPKPMLKVGDKPLLETIVESLVKQGFRRIYIAVNYKAEVVRSRFGDGTRWNADIRYLDETIRLGTAGSLSLLPEKPPAPIVVMNGDLLTNLSFRHLLAYHAEQGCKATVCVREHATRVPYGIVEVRDHRVAAIEEKPVQRHFINAGIYVLDPDVPELVPHGTRYDMTTLIEQLIAGGKPVSVFPIREFWLDIGHHEDYEAANGHYERLFR